MSLSEMVGFILANRDHIFIALLTEHDRERAYKFAALAGVDVAAVRSALRAELDRRENQPSADKEKA